MRVNGCPIHGSTKFNRNGRHYIKFCPPGKIPRRKSRLANENARIRAPWIRERDQKHKRETDNGTMAWQVSSTLMIKISDQFFPCYLLKSLKECERNGFAGLTYQRIYIHVVSRTKRFRATYVERQASNHSTTLVCPFARAHSTGVCPCLFLAFRSG